MDTQYEHSSTQCQIWSGFHLTSPHRTQSVPPFDTVLQNTPSLTGNRTNSGDKNGLMNHILVSKVTCHSKLSSLTATYLSGQNFDGQNCRKSGVSVENFVCRKILSDENFVRRNMLSVELLSKILYSIIFVLIVVTFKLSFLLSFTNDG